MSTLGTAEHCQLSVRSVITPVNYRHTDNNTDGGRRQDDVAGVSHVIVPYLEERCPRARALATAGGYKTLVSLLVVCSLCARTNCPSSQSIYFSLSYFKDKNNSSDLTDCILCLPLLSLHAGGVSLLRANITRRGVF